MAFKVFEPKKSDVKKKKKKKHRNAAKGDDSGLADEVFSNEQAAQMFPQCDYIVSVLPGTPETKYAPHTHPDFQHFKVPSDSGSSYPLFSVLQKRKAHT